MCYGCGHLLWSSVDGAHTFLVDKPSGMTEDEAPASAYLQAVPDCTAGFVYTERGTSTKERWYSCSYCKSNTLPSSQHVGHVLDNSLCVKPVEEWNMSFPPEIHSLANQYECGQMSLCGLFSRINKELIHGAFGNIWSHNFYISTQNGSNLEICTKGFFIHTLELVMAL